MEIYQFIIQDAKHSKSEIYDFCMQFKVAGSITSDSSGNYVIEIGETEECIHRCKNKMEEFLRDEKLLKVSKVDKLTYDASAFLIG